MIAFHVSDMTCGHCVGAITRAVREVDPGARVDIALDTHQVRIAPASTDATALAAAIREAGYTPVLEPGMADVAPVAVDTAPTAGRRGGCGCGCG